MMALYSNTTTKKKEKIVQVFAYPRLRGESSHAHCILYPNLELFAYLRVWRSNKGYDRPFFVLDLSAANILVNVSHFTLVNDNQEFKRKGLNSFNFDGRKKGMSHWKKLFIERLLRFDEYSYFKSNLSVSEFANHTFHVCDEKRINSHFNQFRIILNINDKRDYNQLYVRSLEIFGNVIANVNNEREAKHTIFIHPPLKYIPIENHSNSNVFNNEYVKNFSRYLFSDYGGVFHWLSYNCGQDWKPKNPIQRGLCTVSTSSIAFDSNINTIVSGSPNTDRFITEDMEYSWIMIDFSSANIKVNVTHYALKHYRTCDTYALRNWRFEGFDYKENEWILLMEHENDKYLDERGCTHLWAIDFQTEADVFVDKVALETIDWH